MDDHQDEANRQIAGRPESSADDAAMNPGDEAPPGSPASGEHLCRACGGSGLGDNDEACPECGGTGRVVVAVSAGP
jgi:hypothetical protein